MKTTITVTNTYELTFAVEYFEPTEGGMDHEVFGTPKATLPEALALLDVANESRSDRGWVIVVHTVKKTK